MHREEITVSAIQANLFWEDKDANIALLEHMTEDIGDTDLLVLPEMFTTGFSMRPGELAERPPGPGLQWMKNKAADKNAAVCGSLMVQDGDHFYNRLYFVEPNGHTVYYDKRHLFKVGEEHNHYTAGRKRLQLTYLGWSICPLICYDLRFPVFSRNTRDYDILVYVANWPQKRSGHWNTLLRARAIENQSYVIASNRTGHDGNAVAHNGDSVILDFRGEAIISGGSEPGVITAKLSKKELIHGRNQFPVLEDRDRFSADFL